MDEDEKLRIFNDQHNKDYTSPALDLQNQGTPGQPSSGLSPSEQKVMLELQAKMKAANPNVNVNTVNPTEPMTNTAPSPTPMPSAPPVSMNVQTIGSECPECGVMHPQLPNGEKCPNSKVNLEKISDVEIGQFLGSWKNIIVSQIEQKEIKEPKKVFQQATVILAKFLEEYKEEANAEENPTTTGETQG